MNWKNTGCSPTSECIRAIYISISLLLLFSNLLAMDDEENDESECIILCCKRGGTLSRIYRTDMSTLRISAEHRQSEEVLFHLGWGSSNSLAIILSSCRMHAAFQVSMKSALFRKFHRKVVLLVKTMCCICSEWICRYWSKTRWQDSSLKPPVDFLIAQDSDDSRAARTMAPANTKLFRGLHSIQEISCTLRAAENHLAGHRMHRPALDGYWCETLEIYLNLSNLSCFEFNANQYW
jgi:hypothetical protein